MKINKIRVENFRNIKDIEILPCEGVNIIYGSNAQGKTSLIEAIWLFTGAKSFRGCKEKELIQFGKDFARLDLSFFSQERDQTSTLILADKKKIILNGVDKKSPRNLIGSFNSVVFSPIHLSMIKDGPDKRRRFLDCAIAQLIPTYVKAMSGYNKTLKQRNALLKDIKFKNTQKDLLDTWDQSLIKYGSYIIHARIKYIKRLREHAKDIYKGISGGIEDMEVLYDCNIDSININMSVIEIEKLYYKKMQDTRHIDIRAQTTLTGPHRDDIEINIDRVSAKTYGSQGQQRSCVLALKLSECDIIKNITDDTPIILLDDVMSELDTSRKDYILNKIKGSQVFITCCDKSYFDNLENGENFLIESGELKT